MSPPSPSDDPRLRIQFAPPAEINRELEAIARRLRTQPGRIGRLRESTNELCVALYLRAFCYWDWRGARNYAHFLADYYRDNPKPERRHR